MLFGLSILIIFVLAAVLMFFRKLPAMLALPLMAIGIAMVEVFAGELTLDDVAVAVVADGSLRLADAIVISMFGGMLSMLMQKAGVAESFVRRGAELAGDNPWVVGMVMLAINALLFTTIGGLGAVIMVGTIILPILSSMGMREHISAGILLFGISLGGALNPTNWVVYKNVLGIDGDVVSSFAVVLFALVAVAAMVFLTFELWKSRSLRLTSRGVRRGAINTLAVVAAGILIVAGVRVLDSEEVARVSRWVVGGTLLLLVIVAGLDVLVASRRRTVAQVRWYAYLIPLVPLALILVFRISYVPAFVLGLAYAVLVTYRRGMVNLTARAMIEGSASVIPAIILMLGIGMLLSAILGPTTTGPGKYWHLTSTVEGASPTWPVLEGMKPILSVIVPGSFLSYVLTFSLLGPLALYRGPLNVWGLGYGIGGVLLATGVPAGAVMGLLMSLGTIQGVSDPTNTANVWIANEVRVDVTTLMWRTLPYAWVCAVLGLIVAGLRFIV